MNNQNEADKQVIDFLKYGITYLEKRISIIDNKASILIAAQGVFLALLTYLIKEVFLTTDHACINVASYIVLGGAFILFIATVLLLLQTIRPAKKIFELSIPFKKMEVENYIMWFDDDKFPTTSQDYRNKISTLDLSKIKGNYEKVHFITLQLVRNKYRFYKWAALGMKLLVLWSGIGITVLIFLKW